MSARMLSRQIRPSLPWRAICSRLTEMSISSALWMTGMTRAPEKVTSIVRVLFTTMAEPCSTLR